MIVHVAQKPSPGHDKIEKIDYKRALGGLNFDNKILEDSFKKRKQLSKKKN